MTTEQVIRQKIVDSREPEVIKTKLLEYGWEQKQLYSGDYFFFTHDFKKVTVTRKQVNDLLSSIGERFSKQLEEMLDYSNILILLLEGSWKAINPSQNIITNRGIAYNTWDMVWDYIRRWQDKGFTLELTANEGHTIQRLNRLYALYQKPYSTSARTRDFTDDRILAFPSGCRGKTAQQILENGKSLVDIGLMSTEELKNYEKIGSKKASLIREHFNRRTNDIHTVSIEE